VAAEVTARLVEVRVDEGQRVEKGQLLALLDAVPVLADLHTAQSKESSAREAISIVQADLTEASRILARSQDLIAKGFISRADLTRDEARLKTLDAQLRKSRADLATAVAQTSSVRMQVAKYKIYAPFSGIVIDKSAQAGEIVSPVSAGGGFTRTGICTIVDMESLEIHADVNEAFIGRVYEGQAVEAVLDAYPDVTLRAHVVAIIPTANRDKATVRVRISFDAYDSRILPDMGAKVKFKDRT
jgi:RND family efflux transporter MFP subunit